MPKTRCEAAFIAIGGLVLFVLGAALDPDTAKIAYVLGAITFVIGAALWLIHYSADLKRRPTDGR